MNPQYRIEDTSEIITPALIVFRELLDANIAHMIKIVGDPARLRPHCKTHKTREVVQIQLSKRITKHKCATFAEAEMLANVGVNDIFLAYNLVGPNIARAVNFVKTYPDVTFAVTADSAKPIAQLAEAMQSARASIDVLLDLDVGQHRTGVPVGSQAKELYQQIANSEGLNAGGFHVYDGHQHQESRDERRKAVLAEWETVAAIRNELQNDGLEVPKVVAGGTASFPIYAELDDSTIECSPGTCVYNDINYSSHFPDMEFPPATVILTRVVSRPTENRMTTDLGYKAVASDPPAGGRVTFPDLPDAVAVLQNEEHLVLETSKANEYQPGDELMGIPTHICPTSALHRQIVVVKDGQVADRWNIASRDRQLTI